MSLAEILVELCRKNASNISINHPQNNVLLSSILEEIPYKQVILTQLLFALDQVYELVTLTAEHNDATGLHLGRVGRLGATFAKKLNLHWKDQLECLYGGWIHDIGKMYIIDKILDKPDRLTKEEYELMKLHVQFGCEILNFYPHLHPYVIPVKYHHERWDGQGYPNNLAGDDIPFLGRLTCIVDAYDAMTSSRPYTSRRTHEQAMNEIRNCAGTHFDPLLSRMFCESMSEQEILQLS